MKNVTKLMIALVALVIVVTSCSEYPGFKKDKSGYYYKFYVENKDEIQPQIGDIVEMTYTLRIKDSVFVENAPLYDQIIESIYKGDIYAAMQRMHVGDSATFIMNADSFFHYFQGQPYLPEDKALYFDMKLISVTPKADYEIQQAEQQRQIEMMIEENRLAEDSLINDYVKQKKIKVSPTADGLYIIKMKTGTGAKVVADSKVKVHYTGKFVDGRVFDSSIERGEPIELTVGKQQVIPGWELTLLQMRAGDKVTVIIPSKKGYGSQGSRGGIPPYTPLVFEMEVMSVE